MGRTRLIRQRGRKETDAIDLLLTKKAESGEKDELDHIPAILDFIQNELARQKTLCDHMPNDRKEDWERINGIFVQVLRMEGL